MTPLGASPQPALLGTGRAPTAASPDAVSSSPVGDGRASASTLTRRAPRATAPRAIAAADVVATGESAHSAIHIAERVLRRRRRTPVGARGAKR